MKPLDVQREVKLTLSCLDRIKKAKAPINFADELSRKMIFAKSNVTWIKSSIALTALVISASIFLYWII